ncbi:L-tyrosine/L-tryptophan isonitrile synthase family protein [Pseudomonas sp. RIT-PI-AD]|uniref:L-tyrosine/L-tryptophan isonitrile synthase family protein n=1 Tax=Pseudomonas sp. RIT-PI-AD TaxID=3035294 RepID=UPI0021DB1806|nr:L-tyrosine/L-tryptophan isonitrile synthase family protein [Pseudomonas sp. RIT-PI-AD]
MSAFEHEAIARRVLDELLPYRRRYPESRAEQAADEARRVAEVQLPRIAAFVAAGSPIEFVLPAFPAKSPNPGKVLHQLPDMAERLSLSFLNHLCQRIQLFYPPGAHLKVCSDGRVFGDLVRIGDGAISAYQDALARLIDELGATHIGVFNLEDVEAYAGHGDDHDWLRERLIQEHAEPLERVRETLMASDEGVALYRAITRFLLEDGLTPDYAGSKTALQRDAKERAVGVIQRSWAWGGLLAERFPQAIRLSIHPQPADSLKLGIHMLPTRDDWLTPWHGVAVNTANRFVLMKRSEAQALDAELVEINGQPSHYRLRGQAQAPRVALGEATL